MALTSTILTTTPDSIYTSVGTNVITTMYFCNTGDIAVQFNIHVVPKDALVSDTNIIYYRVPLTSHDTYVIDTEKLMFEDGDALHASIVDPSALLAIGLTDTDWGNNIINAVAWSSDREEYIIVGLDGKVALSDTGESWKYQAGIIALGWPSGINATDVTRIPDQRYVVVGESGWMAASLDGITWTAQGAISTGTQWGTVNINAVTNNGSVYLAVGDFASVATSTNGLSWTFQINLAGTAWGQSDIHSAIWDGERFIIGGDGGKMAMSVDGVVWNFITNLNDNAAWGVNTRVTTLVYSGSPAIGYLAATQDSNKVAQSLDAVTWYYNPGFAAIGDPSDPGASGAAFKPGFGFYLLGVNSIIYTVDAVGTWSKSDSLRFPPWFAYSGTDIIWNSARSEFMAVGFGARVATSADGAVWTYLSDSPAPAPTLPNVVVTISSIGI